MRRDDASQLRDERIPELGSLVRSATLAGYDSLAISLGLDPVCMLQMANLPTEALSNPDILVSLDAVARLLEESAHQSGQDAFSLLLAETRGLNNLGMLGLVIREEPTLRAAVQSLHRYQRLQNGGLSLRLEDEGDMARVHLALKLQQQVSSRQGIEMAAAITLRALRTLSNGRFRPESICFVHGPPDTMDVHRRVLGVPIAFSQNFDAIVCRRRELDLAVPGADPVLGRSIKRWLDRQLAEEGDDPLDRVRQVVRMLLPTGACSADQIAEHLGTHRRTLNRRLAVGGACISAIVDGVRAELAVTYLAEGLRPIYEVANLLGFACGADFSRWFRAHFGMTASQWLQAHKEARVDPRT